MAIENIENFIDAYPTIWIAIGAVIAALIVMYSGYLNLKISRSHAVSDYRQEWINSVREKFSEFLNEADRILSDLSYKHVEETFEEQYPNESQSLKHKLYTVRLFLNKNENEHTELIEKATQLKNHMLYTPLDKIDYDSIRQDNEALVGLFQDILKDEWNRVKWGERTWKRKRRLKTVKKSLLSWVKLLNSALARTRRYTRLAR